MVGFVVGCKHDHLWNRYMNVCMVICVVGYTSMVNYTNKQFEITNPPHVFVKKWNSYYIILVLKNDHKQK